VIEISNHAHQQWRQRSDAPGLDPRLAWTVATQLSGISDFDEGRYHAQSETVLFRRGTVVVTVYDARDVTADLRATINDCRRGPA